MLTRIAGALALGLGLLSSPFAVAQQQTLTIWWAKGFYEAEDIAIKKTVADFEKQTGIKVELSLQSIEDGLTKSISAVEAGSPPDIGFNSAYDLAARGKWAYEGKLDDVSDIVNGIKADLVPLAIESVNLQNKAIGKRSFYAVPIAANAAYIFYWRELLTEAGFTEKDIPSDWNGYWNFWCDKVQPSLRAKGKRTYGMGQPTGVAGDTYVAFLIYLAAYGVKPVDENGKLVIDQPDVRAKVIKAMDDYISIYKRGCTPPSSVTWLDVDNNNNLHNKTTAMTPNGSLSIPGKYLDEKNDEAYYKNLVTAKWPNGLDGKQIAQPIPLKAALIFSGAKNKENAHKFLKFFSQPENYGPYIEGALGRWIPVSKKVLASGFWSDGKDPHRLVAAQVASGPMQPFPTTYDYRFTAVNAENVWAKAMVRIVQDKISTEQAVDEMIARIKQILG